MTQFSQIKPHKFLIFTNKTPKIPKNREIKMKKKIKNNLNNYKNLLEVFQW